MDNVFTSIYTDIYKARCRTTDTKLRIFYNITGIIKVKFVRFKKLYL